MRNISKLAALPVVALATIGLYATPASAVIVASVGDNVTDTFLRTGVDAQQPAGAVTFRLYYLAAGGDGTCTAANRVTTLGPVPIGAGTDSVTSPSFQIPTSGLYNWTASFTATLPADAAFNVLEKGCGDAGEQINVDCPPDSSTTPEAADPSTDPVG